MSNDGSAKIGQFLQGEKEPSSSWVILIIGFVASLIFLVIYNILYPGQDLPVLSSLVPMFEGVFDSGIWFFILGALIGAFAILGTILTEATIE
jgi:uncharacterized membrane protein YeaQ/YmgE (transglycosylase-associated protein family)